MSAPGFIPQLWQPCQMFLSELLNSNQHIISASVQTPDDKAHCTEGRALSQSQPSGNL